MYKLSLKSIVIAFFAMCLILSCQKNKKNASEQWSAADKTAFQKKITKELDGLFRQTASVGLFNVSDTEMKTMLDCYGTRVEKAYDYNQTDKILNQSDIEKIRVECTMDFLLGKKGAWTPKLKQMMSARLPKSNDSSLTDEQHKKLIDCIISKGEQKFAPIDMSDFLETALELAKDCENK